MSLTHSTVIPLSEIELGYRFDPPCPPDQPAHLRLNVWLRTTPTRRHYDPESVECPITSATDTVESLTIQHPWPLAPAYQVGPGRIVLTDRKHKSVEAFSFGSTLQIDTSPTVTVCAFDSEAPILPLLDQESVAGRLATEVEVILAEQRAHWAAQHPADDFANHLACLSAFDLYVACLTAIERHLQTQPTPDSLTHEILRYIAHQRDQQSTAGHWPEAVIPLAQLL